MQNLVTDLRNSEHCQLLCRVIRRFEANGWTPATSSNFSIRVDDSSALISRSGVDKADFGCDDLMHVNFDGQVLERTDARPSAETVLHTTLYRLDPQITCVLHTHSRAATLLSLKHEKQLTIRGLELLKAFARNTTHRDREVVPIVANSQNVGEIAAQLVTSFGAEPAPHGMLIAGHGLYSWGRTIAEAKRHIDAFEFIFDILLAVGPTDSVAGIYDL